MSFSIQVSETLVNSNSLIDADLLMPHELVVDERQNKLTEYLLSLKPYIIIPSILICDKTNMIIDGHHRYYALKKIGFRRVPVTFVNYSSKIVVPHLDSEITKESLIEAATSKMLLPPKSSFHHVLDINYQFQPIILLSTLFRLDLP